MSKLIKKNQWVWVIVQDPGGNEQFLGQRDEERDISFIPVFLEKDDAWQCLTTFVLEKGFKYEAQAILFEELVRHAGDNGFMIFILNSSGEIIEKIKS